MAAGLRNSHVKRYTVRGYADAEQHASLFAALLGNLRIGWRSICFHAGEGAGWYEDNE